MNNHPLFVISGPSGSGKTTSIKKIMQREVVSFTTRKPRVGEVDGVDYIFTTKEEVDSLEEQGKLVERVEYAGQSYGISGEELSQKTSEGPAFVIVDLHGYQQVKELYPNVISIFLSVDPEDARRRMEERGDNPENIEKRLISYRKELEHQIHYNYVIQNEYGKQEKTINILKEIIEKYSA